MSIEEIKGILQNFKRNPKKASALIFIALFIFILGAVFGGFLNEKGRQLVDSSSKARSVKIDMPVDDGMKYTPINLENEVGGKFVGTYVSRDAVAYGTQQEGDTSNLQVTPRNKGS